MNKIDKLKKIINDSKRIVFFTGAGLSTESNIPDFRSKQGVYTYSNEEDPESILSRESFKNSPEKFFKFYKDHLLYPDAKPNNAHIAIAKLEELGKVSAIVTQNIDNLQQYAGSKKVIEIHGSAYRNTCNKCNSKYGLDKILEAKVIPLCDCGGIIEPDIVLFGDRLDDEPVNEALFHISRADTLIIVGTSLSVNPAATFVRYFTGDNLIIINKSKTNMDDAADLVFHDSAGSVLKQLFE